jgi:hypothetical protein
MHRAANEAGGIENVLLPAFGDASAAVRLLKSAQYPLQATLLS